jgi:hypothetical protein
MARFGISDRWLWRVLQDGFARRFSSSSMGRASTKLLDEICYGEKNPTTYNLSLFVGKFSAFI